MKRTILIAAAALTVSVAASAQAQINTKKAQIEDFTEKTTKVVLTGDTFLDAELENAVKDCWRISPYEFCTLDDFKDLKGDTDYYFLIPVSAQYRKEVEPGLKMLSLFKGGKGSDKSLDKMLLVVSAPLCSDEDPSGREMTFMSALIDVIQAQASSAMEKEIAAYVGLRANPRDIPDDANIVFAESDLNVDLTDSAFTPSGSRTVSAIPDDDADGLMEDLAANTIVSYSVHPADAKPNSYCYNLMIGADNHKLYYFRKYKITKTSGVGFQKEDILKIVK